MKERIWELDAARGLFLIGVVIVHLLFDLTGLYGLFALDSPLFEFIAQWGGTVFLLLSGICVTLGSHPVRRGLLVLTTGMLVTAVTAGMFLLELQDASIIIYFGVLHCLGVCMLLWPVFQKLPLWALGVVSAAALALGFCFQSIPVSFPWLIPLGFCPLGFESSDFFPLFPSLGFFLLGAILGKTLYRQKQTLFPKIDSNTVPIRFLCQCGQLSLPIYLIHQPLLIGIIELALALRRL